MTSHRFNPAKKTKLFNDERKKRLQPKKMLNKLGLKKGDIFADIGAGNGFFSIPAAEILKESGKVYAVDVENIMLADLISRAKEKKVSKNIEIIKSGEYAAHLPEKIDFMLFSYLIHEVDKKEFFLNNYFRYLKKGSKAAFVEWSKKEEVDGPPLDHRISRDELKSILENMNIKNIKIENCGEQNYLLWGIKK
ncbi:MAG: class I SAM-dependent methyltransferase [Bacillota bacterium]